MPSSWINEWNKILRTVIFQDSELKTLMQIPNTATIIDFIDSYFIRAGYAGVPLTNQTVRIVYGVPESEDANNPNVSRNTISFDIYVKTTEQHNATTDRLVFRNQLIAERLRLLLMNRSNTYGYKFWCPKERDLGTSMIGYTRYNLTLSYMRVY